MNSITLPPSIWTTGTTEGLKTGTWRAALPVFQAPPSPCHLACPVSGSIAQWMQQALARDWHGAWLTLTDNNPFPAIVGRVCHHPCESACNRGAYDAPLAICALERYVGDRALAQGWHHEPAPVARKARIAIVGGGPSGLSAAYQLRRRGYAVTIFEAQPKLGGLLRDGIPPYRLPREGLDGEIAGFIGYYTFREMNQLILAFHVHAKGEIRLGDELEDFRLISPERLRPWPIGTGPAVRDWLQSRKAASPPPRD